MWRALPQLLFAHDSRCWGPLCSSFRKKNARVRRMPRKSPLCEACSRACSGCAQADIKISCAWSFCSTFWKSPIPEKEDDRWLTIRATYFWRQSPPLLPPLSTNRHLFLSTHHYTYIYPESFSRNLSANP